MEYVVEEIRKAKIGKMLLDEPLSNHTTFQTGGQALVMVYPKDIPSLIKLLTIIKKYNLKYFILGNGSNVIINDTLYNGIVIKLDEFNNLVVDDAKIKVGAGYNLIKLALKVSRMGLTGMEFATGIPGTIGGAIYMNAGAYKSDMGYIVSEIKVLDEHLCIKTIYNKDLHFHYRTSFLKEHGHLICLEATIILKHGRISEIEEVIEERKRRRLMSQPLEYPSAGSVFRNPDGLYAGELIEKCMLKGKQIGGAMVSEKHANFIINVGGASSHDIKQLVDFIKNDVKQKFGVELITEQEFVNWE